MCAPAAPAAAPAVASAAGGTAAAAGGTAAAAAAAQAAAMSQMFYASLALSALSTGVGFASQMAQSSAQNSYQQQMAENANKAAQYNAEQAFESMNAQETQEHVGMMQDAENATEESARIQRERKSAMGTALASSEGAGQSLQFLLNDYKRQEGNYRSNLQAQLKRNTGQRSVAIQGYRRNAEARANATQGYVASPVSSPNPLSALIGFGGQAFNTYGQYQKDKYSLLHSA